MSTLYTTFIDGRLLICVKDETTQASCLIQKNKNLLDKNLVRKQKPILFLHCCPEDSNQKQHEQQSIKYSENVMGDYLYSTIKISIRRSWIDICNVKYEFV